MAPPPRPPIICYDLQTNNNARRTSTTRSYAPATGKTPKITLVRKSPAPIGAFADAYWGSQAISPSASEENTPTRRRPQPAKRSIPSCKITSPMNERTQNKQYHRAPVGQLPPYRLNMVTDPQISGLFGSSSSECRTNSVKTRHAYGQRLKQEAEERNRRRENKKAQLTMQAQLEEISSQLESAKRVQENLLKTFGMSHNAAKYIRQQDQEYARLRQKVDEFAETRAKELGRRVQEMKHYQELQRNAAEKAELRRLRDVSKINRCRRGLSSTLNDSLTTDSPASSSLINTGSSLSTTSPLSNCSSPISILSPISKTTIKSQSTLVKNTPERSVRADRILTPHSTATAPLPKHSKMSTDKKPNSRLAHLNYSFYKPDPLNQQTLEITDTEFFNKVEDNTMLEIKDLLHSLQSQLKDLGEDS